MIDDEGYRLNVGIVVSNDQGQLWWGRRAAKSSGWQFPQGGINEGEIALDAMYRELLEEVGLGPNDVDLIAESNQWLSYDLPEQYRRYHSKPLCIGQKQRWFLLRLVSSESTINLEATSKPEFVEWRWVDYWYAVDHIIDFKREVYQKMLEEFQETLLPGK